MRFGILLALLMAATLGHAQQPTPESVDKLLTVMHAQDTLDAMMQGMQRSIPGMIDHIVEGQHVPAAQEQDLRNSLNTVIQRDVQNFTKKVSWTQIKGDLRKVYIETLTQEEVSGMTTFYQSPVGASVLKKMPVLMQKSMEASQHILAPQMRDFENQMMHDVEQTLASKGKAPAGK